MFLDKSCARLRLSARNRLDDNGGELGSDNALVRGNQPEAMNAGGSDDGAGGWVAKFLADRREFGGDLEGERQNLKSGIRFQFSEEFLGRFLRSEPAFRDQDAQFDEAKRAHGNRPRLVYFCSENPELLFCQFPWIISPVQNDVRIG